MIPFLLTLAAPAFLDGSTTKNVTTLEMIFNAQREFFFCGYRYPFKTWTPPMPKIVEKREQRLARVRFLRGLTSCE